MQLLEDNNILVCVCNRCGTKWKPNRGLAPKTCANPDCRSDIWDKDIYSHICLRCSREWISTIQYPGVCPNCKSSNWDERKEDHIRRL